MHKKLALIGGTGALGQNMVSLLNAENKRIKVISSKSERFHLDLSKKLEDVYFLNLIEDCDTIIILSTMKGNFFNQKSFIDQLYINVVNMKKIINLSIREQKKIVYLSGAIVYQNPYAYRISEDSQIGYSGLGGSYGMSKFLIESYLSEYSISQRICIVRPSSIFGLGFIGGEIVSSLVHQAKERNRIEIREPILQEFGFISSSDLSLAIMHLIDSNLHGVYNVSMDTTVSLKQILLEIQKISDCQVNLLPQIEPKSFHNNFKRRYDLDTSKLMKTGWRHRFDLRNTLTDIFNY